MKTPTLLFIALGSISFLANAQSNMERLDVNNIEAGINPNGQLFYSEEEADPPDPIIPAFVPAFEVPKGSGKTAIYAGNLWIGAKTPGGATKSAVHLFKNNMDFEVGPIANQFGTDYEQKYNRVWKVDRQTIEAHFVNFQSPNYVMPEVIQNWPGNGNVTNGEAATLAPFVDVNNNNLYEPEMGDYPCIQGNQAVFAIFNDVRRDFDGTFDSLRVEVHLMAYALNKEGAENDAIYVHYTIHNRSNINYRDVYLGIHTDADLGCMDDDYVGSDSSLNSYFFYNGDDFDEDCRGLKGYGARTPAIGVVTLNRNMSSMINYFRGTGPQGDPIRPQEHYNYLTARWRDSTRLTFGEKGYLGTMSTNFMYPGDPRDTNQWSDAQVNPAFDRSGLSASGPFVLNAGNSLDYDIAFVYAEPPFDTTSFVAIDYIKPAIVEVQNAYDSRDNSLCYIATDIEEYDRSTSVVLYPNPTADQLILDFKGDRPQTMRVMNLLGEQLKAFNSSSTTIDVSDLPNGVYLLQMNWEGQIAVKRFSVAR